ncbi:MAG: hypothetical protein ABIJ09_23385 [Pseudomonadota bacterium]
MKNIGIIVVGAMVLAAVAHAEDVGETASSGPVQEPAAASGLVASEGKPSGPVKMAVPRMHASKPEDAELALMLSEILTVEARKVHGMQVLGMSDIEATLGFEQQKQLLGCDDVSCMAELGGAMGARLILSSKVGRVGDTYVLALSVVDTHDVKVLNSTYDTVEGKPDALIARIRSAVPGLLDPVIQKQQGPVLTTSTTASPKSGSGNELVLNWPALIVAGAGVGLLIGTGVAATFAYLEGDQVLDSPGDFLPDNTTLYPPGNAYHTVQSQILWYVALGLGATGLAAAAGGMGWQVLSQGGE